MTALATDTFSRANEDPIATPWVTLGAGFEMFLQANVLGPFNISSDSWAYYDGGISWPNDQYAKMTCTVTGTAGGTSGIGPMVRKASGATETFYRLVVDHAASNNVSLGKVVAGSYTNIVTVTNSWSDGDTWELRAIGTTLSIWKNGSQVSTNQTDSSIASGKPGVAYSSTETAASVDAFEAGSTATASAALTGTATASITETDVVTGGKTIIITLTNDTFIAA